MQCAEIPIPVPCEVRLEDMQHREPGRRYCEHCRKHVHSLSAMTEREAKAFLERAANDADLCVSYAVDPAGKLLFAPEPRGRLVRLPVAVGVAAAIAACSPSKPTDVDDRPRPTASALAAASASAAAECAKNEAREKELEQKVAAATDEAEHARLQAELAKARESHLGGRDHRMVAGKMAMPRDGKRRKGEGQADDF